MDEIMDTYPEGLVIRLAHVGINTGSAAESRATAEKMARMFCTYVRSGNNSNFVSDMFEIVRFKGRGTHGHIGMETNSVSLALDYLRPLALKRICPRQNTKKMGRFAMFISRMKYRALPFT